MHNDNANGIANVIAIGILQLAFQLTSQLATQLAVQFANQIVFQLKSQLANQLASQFGITIGNSIGIPIGIPIGKSIAIPFGMPNGKSYGTPIGIPNCKTNWHPNRHHNWRSIRCFDWQGLNNIGCQCWHFNIFHSLKQLATKCFDYKIHMVGQFLRGRSGPKRLDCQRWDQPWLVQLTLESWQLFPTPRFGGRAEARINLHCTTMHASSRPALSQL